MGTNCSHHDPPNPTNECSQFEDPTSNYTDGKSRHFCTLAGSGGNQYRTMFCESIGEGEWETGYTGDSCSYNDCDKITSYGGGCCKGCCGIAGRSVVCQRNSYKAAPLNCCFNDFACSPTYGSDIHDKTCFEDGSRFRTCDPGMRDMASSNCKARILDYCAPTVDMINEAGSIVSNPDYSPDWLARWYTNNYTIIGENGVPKNVNTPCLSAIYRNLYSQRQTVGYSSTMSSTEEIGGSSYSVNIGPENPTACTATYEPAAPIDSAGYAWAQNMLNSAITQYVSQGGNLLGQEGDIGVNSQFNAAVFGLCKQYPGLCTSTLRSICSSVTTDQLTKQVGALNWCGCNMQDSQYATYTNLYQINKECTPMCNQASVIPLADVTGLAPKRCLQDFCLMDKVAITLAESQVGGTGMGISFSQICSSCSGNNGNSSSGGNSNNAAGTGETISSSSKCSCIMSDLDIEAVNSSIQGINVSQNCANTTCYKNVTLADGTVKNVPVPCDSTDGNPYANYDTAVAAATLKAESVRNYRILYILIAVVVFIVVLYFMLRPHTIAETEGVLPRYRRIGDIRPAAPDNSGFQSINSERLTKREFRSIHNAVL